MNRRLRRECADRAVNRYKNKKRWLLPIVLTLLVAIWPLYGDVSLPDVISSHMVLQRHLPVRIYGTADPDEAVSVTFGGQTKNTQADTNGNWHVFLDAMEANATGRQMTISGNNSIVLDDILVGAVWLGSGQSNMDFALRSATGGGAMAGIATNLPTIRLFEVPYDVQPTDTLVWHASHVDADYYSYVRDFSAVLYYMGHRLHEDLNVPIGLMLGAKGATAISGWIATPDNPHTGLLFKKQIAPMAPFTIRGVAWYQGEADAMMGRGLAYADDMQDLIDSWRAVWEQPEMPFYFVQIAPCSTDSYAPQQLPALWEAQVAALKNPYTGMAVVTDMVDDFSNIHPPKKEEVGDRLALWALAKDYGQTDLVYSGPLYASSRIEADKIRISFVHGEGLKSNDGNPLNEFKIAGADGVFVDATAVIDGDTVLVSSPAVQAPKVVQFGWHKTAQPNLVNGADLPASPFQTDNWQGGIDIFRPSAPTGLATVPGDGQVSLDWDDNIGSNLTYSVYRSTELGGYTDALASNLISSAYVDDTVSNGTTYYYAVTAVDTNGSESAQSSEVFAIPSDPGNQAPSFTSDPILETNAVAGEAYTATIADDASDPESDEIIFSMLSGASWLTLAADGSLIGAPKSFNIGTNLFTVRVDAEGGHDTATLKIVVDIPPSGFEYNTFQYVINEGGDYWLTNAVNWSDDMLPTMGTGRINEGTDGKLDTADGWNVVQNGSTVGISGVGLSTTLDDCTWIINGGQLGDVMTFLKNSTKVTVNTNGTLAAGANRGVVLWDDAQVEVNNGTLTAGNSLLVQDQCRIYGSGTFNCGDIEVIENAVINLTNSTITVGDNFGHRAVGQPNGSVTLNGCTLSADFFKVMDSGFELIFAGSTEGSATFTDWTSGGADDGMIIDFQAGTGMSMALGGAARALSISSAAWGQALWENDQLLYNGSSSTDLGGLSWAEAASSGIGVGNGEYFEFTPNGRYGGTLALATTGPDTTPPAAPTGLTTISGNNSVSLNWNDNTEPDWAGYSVYRSTTSSNFSSSLVTDLGSNAYVDTNVVNGTTYYYVVTAVDTHSNESAYSSQKSAMPTAIPDTTPPAAPTGLTATADPGSVNLNWNDNGEGDLAGYSVYRSTSSGNYSDVPVTNLDSSAYVDTDVVTDTTYYYVVTATDNSSNESDQSTEESITFVASAQNTLISGLITESGNWDTGLPDTEGNIGIIDFDNTGANEAYLADTINNLFILQTGGTATKTGWLINHDFFRSRYEIIGGEIDTSTGFVFDDNSSFTISGGAVKTMYGLVLKGGSSFSMSGGTLDAKTFTTHGGTHNFAGGVTTFEYFINPYSSYGTFNFSGDVSLNITGQISENTGGDRFVNIGTGTGSITANALEAVNMTIDWAPGSGFSITVTNILEGGAASSWEALWNAGQMTYSGNDFTTLGDWSAVTAADGLEPGVRFDYDSETGRLTLSGGAPQGGYEVWAAGWGTNDIGSATNDFDSDGLNNLYEYAMDGNPTNGLVPTNLPLFSKVGNGFIYVQPQRSDDTNLIYMVETTTSLMSGSWTNEGYIVTGTNITGETLNFVTNDVGTVENEKFIRLRVGQ